MTDNTTNPSETSTGNSRPSRGHGPRCCRPRSGGPFAGPFGGHFRGPFGPQFAGMGGAWRRAPVNIEDAADAYIISLYAAGLDKSGIRVSAQGDVLSIRYTAPEADDSARSFTRRELPQCSFEREFALNAKVQLDAISATYSDGVLVVRLPKTPDAMEPEREVPVQ